jgi:glutathione synthase/RimK-type ligase-like ATP-grasp enzyme
MTRKIAVLYGMENTFPPALVEEINSRGVDGVEAVHLHTGGIRMGEPSGYRVIVDRISQDIPFYRAYLKNAVLTGSIVVNNPFWWSADDKFFNYALADKLGVAIPRTVLLPHREHPESTTEQSMRNLMYPLNWDEICEYVGFPAFLKPFDGGGWKHVYKVHSKEEMIERYNETGRLCMTLQAGVEFDEYYRCYVIGQEKVRIMRYDPSAPHADRYVKDGPAIAPAMEERITEDCLKICRALGYDMNTVEFACRDGVPYAIDYLNPAPDGELTSVGADNFHWFVKAMADLTIELATSDYQPSSEYRWSRFLNGDQPVIA